MSRQTTQQLITALYPRLSHEDTLQGESNSISNQENICQGGCHRKGAVPIKHCPCKHRCSVARFYIPADDASRLGIDFILVLHRAGIKLHFVFQPTIVPV